MQFVFELGPVNWRLKLAASETPATNPRHKGSLGPATLRGPHQVISSLPSTKRPLGYWALACRVAAHNKAQARIDRIEVPVQAANQSLSMMMGRTAGNSWPSRGSTQPWQNRFGREPDAEQRAKLRMVPNGRPTASASALARIKSRSPSENAGGGA